MSQRFFSPVYLYCSILLLIGFATLANGQVILDLPDDANAGEFFGDSTNTMPSTSIPPMEQAFQLNVLPEAGQLVVHWQILPQTYLYRHALAFSLLNDSSELQLGEPLIPDGKQYQDEYFGEVETYRYDLTVKIPVSRVAAGSTETVDLRVKYQGCADAGICYPPQQKIFSINTTAIGVNSNVNNNASRNQTDDNWFNSAPDLSQLSLLDLLRFFGFGLLLGFTPCVFPMAPILSRIIVGPAGITRGPRALGLSLTYVFSTAVVFAVAGAVVGAAGSSFVAQLQHPIAYIIFAVLFVVLALSMFGLYKLELPSRLQTWVTGVSNQQKPGSYLGAMGMGVLAAFLVSGCATPLLFAVLLDIAQTGDAMKGALALFMLALGMGAPLVLMATLAGRFLPHAGTWMQQIQITIGIIMLALGLLMLHRVENWPELLWAWLTLYPLAAVLILFKNRQGWVIVLITWLLITATAYFGARPWLQASMEHYADSSAQPWLQASIEHSTDTSVHMQFEAIKGIAELDAALASMPANADGSPRVAMLDFYADWCVSCIEMEQTTFREPNVLAATDSILRLQTDLTQNDAADQAMLQRYQLPGPPAILFWVENAAGEMVEQPRMRIVGKMSAEEFLQHVQRVQSATTP